MSDLEKAGIAKDKIGAPSFFVNVEPIFGAVPYENLEKIIDGKLTE